MRRMRGAARPGLPSLTHFLTLDFIITGSSYELLEHEIKPLVEQFLNERGLELSPEKTRITHIEDGFDFLGHHVRKYAGNPCRVICARKI